jgi:flavodoxin
MKTTVLYESQYGNTETIAGAIATAASAELRPVVTGEVFRLDPGDLLIVGCPTQGGRPTKAITAWLASLPDRGLEGISAAVFDTRFAPAEHGFGLRLLMRVIGFAAPRIASQLERKGATLVTPPEGFIVRGKEGPLKQGETERATAWARALVQEAQERASVRTDVA